MRACSLLVIAVGISCSLIGNEKLIKDFFIAKHSRYATILGCERKKDSVSLMKSLNEFSVNYFNIQKHGSSLNMTETLKRQSYYLSTVIDGSCNETNEVLQRCGIEKLFVTAQRFLIITPNEDFIDIFENVPMRIDAEINVAVPNQESESTNISSYTIWDVYNPSTDHGGELKVQIIGYHSEDDGYNARIIGSRYWARKNMTGVRFKSAVVIPKQTIMTVEEYLANDTDKEVNSMHRFQSVTVKHCQDMYNFSMDIRSTESWGYIVPNTGGKFDGLVGLLQRREVDFGCSPLICKYDRLPVVDYSFGNWILKSVFIYQPPKSTASSFEIFTRPLGADVWLSTFLITILIAVCLKMLLSTEGYFKRGEYNLDTKWSYIFVTLFGSFCLQSPTYSPNLYSGRIMTLNFLIFYIMLYQFYAGFIVSYLLMDPPRSINNLDDLLHSSLDAGIENILIDRDYFVQTTDPVAIELFKSKVLQGNRSGFYEPMDGMDLVKRGGFAFHIETSTAYPIIRKFFPPKIICILEEVQMYRTQPMHTNAQKGSPFREMLNYCMLRLVEAGLMYRLRNHWDAHKPECIEADHVIEVTVGLAEFNSALVFLSVGVVSGLFFLFCERYYVSRKMKIEARNRDKLKERGAAIARPIVRKI